MTDIEILESIAYYDGYNETLSAIANDMEDYIKNRNNSSTVYSYSEANKHVASIKWDSELMVFWEYLVFKFGNYGTSPRSGWIEDIDGCIKFIQEKFSKHEGC